MRSRERVKTTANIGWSYRKSQIPLTPLANYQDKAAASACTFRRGFLCENLFLLYVRGRIRNRDGNVNAVVLRGINNVEDMRRENPDTHRYSETRLFQAFS